MIARVWTARASAANARRYAEHLRDAVLPVVQRVPGYAGATLLERRASEASRASGASGASEASRARGASGASGARETGSADDEIVITVITWWRSEAAIRAFAGDNITRAIVTDEARGLLSQFDDTVRHFEVMLDDRPG